jgi:glycosyltransferase involved in cell wall biosynthesis
VNQKYHAMTTVSVILPTFNRARFLRLAIESVFAQTFTDWELIIADDGSTEETRAYLGSIASPRVRVIWLQHSGNPSRVRNAGIRVSGGRYLAFLDSDDIWAPTKLEKQIAALGEHAPCRWSYTNCDLIDEQGFSLVNKVLVTPVPPDGWIFEPLLRLQVAASMPAVVADRDLVREIGCFDERQRFGEWHDLCLRLAIKSPVVALSESLCSVRIHNEHYSADKVGEHLGWMQLYKKMGDLAPSPALRSYCGLVRAEASLKVARFQCSKGDYGKAFKTLLKSLPFSWPYPQWWWGVLKGLARAVIPRFLMPVLRRSRKGTTSK